MIAFDRCRSFRLAASCKRYRACYVVVITVFGFICFSNRCVADLTISADPVLDLLINGNAAARDRIHTISFNYVTELKETPLNAPPFDDRVTGRVIESGGRRFWTTDAKWKVQDASGSPLPPQRFRKWMVLTDTFFAFSQEHEAFPIQMIDHTSLASLSDKTKIFMHTVGEDVLRYAYGGPESSLSQIYQDSRRTNRWEVQQVPQSADGKHIYRLTRYWLPRPGGKGPTKEWIRQIWEIDGDSKLVVSVKTFMRPEEVAEEHFVHSRQVDGIWVPDSIVYNQYRGMALRGKNRPASREERALLNFHSHIVLSDIAVNRPVPDSAFSLSQLGMPDGRIIMHTGLNQKTTIEYLWGGVAVPASVHYTFARMQHQADANRRRAISIRNRNEIIAACVVIPITFGFIIWVRSRRRKTSVGGGDASSPL